MTNEEIIAYIYENRQSIKKEKNLDRMIYLMEQLGNPQDDLKFIHIAGTNGKGSTTAMLAKILYDSGYNVGKFISPFIISFNERIQVNDKFITDEDLTFYIEKIKPIVSKMVDIGMAPIGFEIVTAIAFMYYKDKNCDFVVLETGLGGRFDPTNIIKNPILSIITVIDYDHTHILGDKIEQIASEKCGIIKPNGTTITYPFQDYKALSVIRRYCSINNNKLYVPNVKFLNILKSNQAINYFSYKGTYYKLHLIGKHQIYNALMVILACNVLINMDYEIPFSAISSGICNTRFPARLEKVSRKPLIFLDGSHNISGARALKDFLYTYRGKRCYAIMGFSSGKNPAYFLEEVGSYFREIAFVKYTFDKYKPAEDPKRLVKIATDLGFSAKAFDSLAEAKEYVLSRPNPDLILITGSLYLASEYRNMSTDK